MENHKVEEYWDGLSEEWEKHISDEGDLTRTLNSDPLIWKWIYDHTAQKDLTQLTALDAGCGNGYLTTKLAKSGFKVIGVDLSAKQLEFAHQRVLKYGVEGRVVLYKESAAGMVSVGSGSVDLLVSNFVLMDLEKYGEAVREFHRVLKSGGKAILTFLHPCFDTNTSKTPEGHKILTWPVKGSPNSYYKGKLL
eukprot:TRINITY_DN21039_c0_g1_i2.p1 TRINITY_DN21039_c0_g1~~TRINITY_DN21039_c0_g1_i2.p1  ORF type:complete len:204 (+),score=57.33 TRINITY_DN21039_c0_g1_i2:34-612(+)